MQLSEIIVWYLEDETIAGEPLAVMDNLHCINYWAGALAKNSTLHNAKHTYSVASPLKKKMFVVHPFIGPSNPVYPTDHPPSLHGSPLTLEATSVALDSKTVAAQVLVLKWDLPQTDHA